MSNNVMQGLRHSSLRPCSLFCPPFTWKAQGAFTSAFMWLFFKVKKVSVSSGFEVLKSPSVYAVASKGKRTTSPQTYWFIFPRLHLLRCQDVLLLNVREGGRALAVTLSYVKMSRTSEVDSFPKGEGPGVAARVPVCVLAVIDERVCEPVNHTVSAQMPLGLQLPATAIKYRWYGWPNSFPSFTVSQHKGLRWWAISLKLNTCVLHLPKTHHPHNVTVVMNTVIRYSVWYSAGTSLPQFHPLGLILSIRLIPDSRGQQSMLSTFPQL